MNSSEFMKMLGKNIFFWVFSLRKTSFNGFTAILGPRLLRYWTL